MLKGRSELQRGEGPRAGHAVVQSTMSKVLEKEEMEQFAFTSKSLGSKQWSWCVLH